MTIPRAIALNFKTTFAQVAALDELSIIEGKSRVDVLREAIHIGLMEKLMQHEALYNHYMEACRPKPKVARRGKIYRFAQ